MIKKIELTKFKRYKKQTIILRPRGITILAGGNNSGKSTLLHAIAIWEFCKLILELEKGKNSLLQNNHEQGLGVSADEFLPIAIPTLKHLWTNLKTQKEGDDIDGYNLKINCYWENDNIEKFLEISLSLANDRLFIKVTRSNLKEDDYIPTAAYLPTFAGILEKENKVSLAERRKYIGKGLAGSVLRNLLLELNENSKKKRNELKEGRAKIPTRKLKEFKKTDPYELLLQNIRTLFKTGIRINDFNDLYHTSIRIDSFKGDFTERGVFKKHPSYNYRDLMVEGSGFLQWLNVFTLSLNPQIDIVLLDEPDAHLHPSLQIDLIEELKRLGKNKQFLIATHSSEIIKQVEAETVLNINNSPKYLKEERQKVGLLAGIGSDYSPLLDKVKKTRKILFIEGSIDFELLRKVGEIINQPISNEIIPWITPTGHKERKHLFDELKKEIHGLKGFSIRDRDDEAINTVDNNLNDRIYNNNDTDFKRKKWKRRNIESYLIIPSIISEISRKGIDIVTDHLATSFAITIPENFIISDVPNALLQLDGKDILKENDKSIEKIFNVNRREIIEKLTTETICSDLIKMVNAINQHFEESRD